MSTPTPRQIGDAALRQMALDKERPTKERIAAAKVLRDGNAFSIRPASELAALRHPYDDYEAIAERFGMVTPFLVATEEGMAYLEQLCGLGAPPLDALKALLLGARSPSGHPYTARDAEDACKYAKGRLAVVAVRSVNDDDFLPSRPSPSGIQAARYREEEWRYSRLVAAYATFTTGQRIASGGVKVEVSGQVLGGPAGASIAAGWLRQEGHASTRPVQVELSGPGGGAVQFQSLSDEALATELARLRSVNGG